MARELPDETTVDITCVARTQGPELIINGTSLDNVDDEDSILIEFSEDHSSPQALIIIRSAAGNGHTAHVWEVTGSTHDAWSPHSGGGRSRRYSHAEQARQVLITLVPDDIPPPQGPPAPGSGSTVLEVNVRKSGSMPLPPGGASSWTKS